jgi:DNA-binding NarL/FixJ family response regulator
MMRASRHAEFVARLAAAERFVDAAALVCEAANAIGTRQCAILAHNVDGRISFTIDNLKHLDDVLRARALDDPAVARTVFGGPRCVEVPVISLAGSIATILCTPTPRSPPTLEREIAVLAAHLSVWCATRGVFTFVGRADLSPQQHRIARLAARGRFNIEIARDLGISINTVKLRLKQVFERLGIDNRVELVQALHGLATANEVPPGITRLPNATATRAETRSNGRAPSRRRGT